MNYYNLLEVPFTATHEEIRKSFFEAAKQFHPDSANIFSSQEKFLKIKEAYETLIDPSRRAEYDSLLMDNTPYVIPVKLNYSFSRPSIPLLQDKQTFYTYIEIEPSKSIIPDLLPSVNICLVIDRSTSMQGEHLSTIKHQAINFLKTLRPIDTISIVTFSDFAELVVPPTTIENLDEIIFKLQSIKADGSTEIFQGLSLGTETLRQLMLLDKVNQLILITDGHTYGDEEKCLALVNKASHEGITFHGIGIGEDWNDKFLDELAKLSGGETRFVSSSKELYNILTEKIQETEVVYARNVRLKFKIDPLAKLTYIFRLSPDLSMLDLDSPIYLGNLHWGKNLKAIFEFRIDELPPSMNVLKLMEGSISMEIPTENVLRHRLDVDLSFSILPKVEKETPPPAIVNALSRLSLYRIQEKAKNEIEAGDIRKATRYYHHIATHLLARGDRDLAKTVLREAETLQHEKKLSNLGEKKIKYGTRALLELPDPEMKKL